MMQVPPQARAGGGEAKQHLETKQEDCARDGQIGWAGVRGTTANKANQRDARGKQGQPKGCVGEGAKPQPRSMQMRGGKSTARGPTPQGAPHHGGGGGKGGGYHLHISMPVAQGSSRVLTTAVRL